jgi:hypothetical protein
MEAQGSVIADPMQHVGEPGLRRDLLSTICGYL